MGTIVIQSKNYLQDLRYYINYFSSVKFSYKNYILAFFNYPGLRLLFILRISIIMHSIKPIFSIPFVWLTRFIYKVDFGPKCYLGPCIYFPHPFNIVIGGNSVIEGHCSIFDGVSIGKKYPGTDNPMPNIGTNTQLYSGAKVLGDIMLEGNNFVGANSVCTISLKEYTSCVGFNKIIKYKKS